MPSFTGADAGDAGVVVVMAADCGVPSFAKANAGDASATRATAASISFFMSSSLWP